MTRRAVYVATRTGRRFHTPGCIEVDQYKAPKGVLTLTAQQIRDRGLEPCKVCRPSTGLAVVR